MDKRGLSAIIAWVLLVGLSVGLGIIVTTWAKQQASKTVEGTIQNIEGDLRCAEVSFKAFVMPPPCDINISNTGYYTIVNVSVRHQFGTQIFAANLLPQQDSKVLNIQVSPPIQLDIIPIIRSEKNQLIGCADRKLVLTC